MTWLRRATANPHECPLPMRPEVITVTASLNPRAVASPVTLTVIDGRHGDLWRCDDCSKTWRVGLACGVCDAYGPRPHGGQHGVGLTWRRASWWQARRNR